jgi:hypothetical protein
MQVYNYIINIRLYTQQLKNFFFFFKLFILQENIFTNYDQ